MADIDRNVIRQQLEDEERSARYTQIGSWRDIVVGAIFMFAALVRFLPPFNGTTPTVIGLIWISFIGLYGLYRMVRGIIKFGSDGA